MIISYDNLITRLWLSGAIMPYEKGGYANNTVDEATVSDECDVASNEGDDATKTAVDTLINARGLPPIPHQYWIDRLGFQQNDPVTDFRSGGVLGLAMLVHIVESCPTVHARFVPKMHVQGDESSTSAGNDITLEEIITDDASVLPLALTCINITDMLAKFLLFSKSIDKMDALLSAKPFWKMFIDPNAMLVLQEVSLDLMCDVCVEMGRERRLSRLTGGESDGKKKKTTIGMHGTDGKVTVFDFAEIMERTEKRVGDEILGEGPQNVEELRAVARRVKSKYLMRIQLKEKHLVKQKPPLIPSMPTTIPGKESVKNVTTSMIGGVGGIVNRWKGNGTAAATDGNTTTSATTNGEKSSAHEEGEEVEIQFNGLGVSTPSSLVNPVTTSSHILPTADEADIGESIDASALAEAFDLLGGDFNAVSLDDIEHSDHELLDAMDVKLDPTAAFTIDDDDFQI